MMTFLTYLFVFLLIVDSFFLTLLIMVQLPKKEAGAGMAFGGGAADALFGAGSGNALTKLTKYFAIGFFVLVMVLSYLDNNSTDASGQKLRQGLRNSAAVTPTAPAPATTPPASVPTSSTPALSLTIGSNSAPSAPVTAPATNNSPK